MTKEKEIQEFYQDIDRQGIENATVNVINKIFESYL